MTACLLAFIFGCISLQFFQLPSVMGEVVLTILTIFFLLLGYLFYKKFTTRLKTKVKTKFKTNKKTYLFCFSFSFFILGLLDASLSSQAILKNQLPATLINQVSIVEGEIVTLPATMVTSDASKALTRFDFLMSNINHQPERLLIRVSWYGQHPPIYLGDRWRLYVRLKPPQGLKNPSTFNYQEELFTQKIRALGYVQNHFPNQSCQLIYRKNSHSILSHWRQSILSCIQKVVINPELSSILVALTLGFKGLLLPNQWQVLQKTGTYHLVVIAGLHIGFVAELTVWFIRRVWSLFPAGVLRMAAQPFAALFGLSISFIYSYLAGFSIPTERAVIMLAILLGVDIFYESIAFWRRIILAAFVILMLQPLSSITASFWLSFFAISCIGYGLHRLRFLSTLRSWLSLQWILFLGLAPITFYYFQQISLVGLMANLIAIPWIGMLIVPLCLLGALVLLVSQQGAALLFKLAAHLLYPIYQGLLWLSQKNFVVWHHSIHFIVIVITSSIGVGLLLAPQGFKGRWLGIFWLLPLFFFPEKSLKFGEIQMSLLDVGQGLSAVIQTKQHTLLFDAGPKNYGGFDAGRSVVVPYFYYLNLNHLDMMMISHGDNDHIGGSGAVLENFKVNQILTSVPNRFTSNQLGLKNAKTPVETCYAGEQWEWDGVVFEVLSPGKNESYQDNNSSCVLHIRGKNGSILLTGDIEREREQWLLTQGSNALSADILVAPHHGSRTSSSIDFAKAVSPRYVLFPAGAYNKFHFPAPEIVTEYLKLGAKTICIGEKGAVLMDLPIEGKIKVKTMEDQKKFWEG